MKIVNKETLAAMPIGTVFTLWQPNYMDGELHIKTGDSYTDDRPSWNGELYVHPDMYDISDDISLNTDIHSNMWTTDDSDIDYNDDQLFMVFSYPEVLNMANALLWASNECKGEFNMDISFLGDKIIQEED